MNESRTGYRNTDLNWIPNAVKRLLGFRYISLKGVVPNVYSER